MGRTRVYLKPFANDVGSAYESSWREVTDDVVDLGDLSQQLDNTEYDVGVFRAGNLSMKLRNDHGRYGAVGAVETIFKYKRGDSLVRITWEPGDGPLICGFFAAGHPGSILSEEVEVFEGLLNDTGTKSPIDEQIVDFQIQGYESLLATLPTPYASISNGDTMAEAILATLDQAPLNARATVSAGNISTGVSVTLDDKTEMENKTALEVLRVLLFASSSVLWIRDGVVNVGPRTASPTDAFTFYGQGSLDGIENILDINDYRTGEHRVLNYLTWKDTTLLSQDATSVGKYMVRKKQLDVPYITDTTKRTNLLNGVRNEFATPKREFLLSSALTPELLELFLLDKVVVDYPSPYVPDEGRLSRPYGIAEYGVDYYAESLFALTIESSARFKIMSRKLSFKNQTASFALREV